MVTRPVSTIVPGLLLFAMGACSGPDEGAGITPDLIGNEAPAVQPGTELSFRVQDDVSLDSHRLGDTFTGRLIRPVRIGGTVVLPQDTESRWEITRATADDGRGSAVLAFRLTSIRTRDAWRSVSATSTSAALNTEGSVGATDVRVGAEAEPVGEPFPADTPDAAPPIRRDARAVVALATSEGAPRMGQGSVITVRLDQPITLP